MREMTKNTRGKSFFAFIAAVLIFLFMDPYFMWNLGKSTPIYAVFGVFLLFIFSSNTDIKTKGRGPLFLLFSILLFLSVFYENLNLFGALGTLCLLFVPFAKLDFAKKIFDYFLTIYSVYIGISGIIWILSLIGIVNPIGLINPLNEIKPYNYNVYPFLVRPDTYYPLERFCGPFDEPGVIGTISALILTVGRFNLRNKRLLIVFVTGILSMSFFYYGIIAVYYSIFTLTISKNKKSGLLVMLLLALAVTVLLNNELFYENLWSRFIWDEDAGGFAGDDRSSGQARVLVERYKGSFEFFLGAGKSDEFIRTTRGEASLLNTVVQFGLIYVVNYVLVFAVYGWNYKKNIITYILFLFVFIGCIYQRPFLFEPEFIFLFSLMAMSCGELFADNKERDSSPILT